jgi:hypothetical protein
MTDDRSPDPPSPPEQPAIDAAVLAALAAAVDALYPGCGLTRVEIVEEP